MELLTILRLLWARRILVALGALVAAAVAVYAVRTLPPPGPPTWVASLRVLVDTSDSELVHAAPKSAETLPMRALVAADLVSGDSLKSDLARRAGIDPAGLEVAGPAARAEPPTSDELVEQAVRFAGVTRAQNVLSLYADGMSPIVAIEANAPDAKRALTLATAARSLLESSLRGRSVSADGGFVVKTVASPRAKQLSHGSRRGVLAAIGAIALFGLWCVVLVVVTGLAGRARRPQTA